jgi:FAD binding domain of DNA photolyase
MGRQAAATSQFSAIQPGSANRLVREFSGLFKQFNATGFMSNRGRQIAASCLANELAVDWCYGTAYFEQQPLDYIMTVFATVENFRNRSGILVNFSILSTTVEHEQ